MKIVDCDVIQDLLPSYKDKISSSSTNKLVEEHLKICENCRKVLESENEEIELENLEETNEEINYLKGYRKSKIITVVFAILLTIDIIVGSFLLLEYILPSAFLETEFFASIDKINIEYMYEFEDRNEKDSIGFYLYSDKYKEIDYSELYEVINDKGQKEIHYVIVAKGLIKPIISKQKIFSSGMIGYTEIEDNVSKIYIEDKRGHSKELWNRDMEIMSREEWIQWYLDSYVPEEIKDKYNMNYDIMYKVHPSTAYYPLTSSWRHLYDIDLK